jgi:hypothetical protein
VNKNVRDVSLVTVLDKQARIAFEIKKESDLTCYTKI